jgi:predicted nucleotidyltransferase component of viral defense system
MSDDCQRIVDIRAWIDRARRDPLAYIERQATEIVLAAVNRIPLYGSRMYLKGGVLMAVVYQSPRNTADLDFSTDLTASPDLPGALREALEKALPATAAQLGYADLVLRVQSVRERPRPFGSPGTSFPALDVNVGYAKRGSPAEERLARGQAPHVVHMEVSFNEPIHAVEMLRLGVGGPSLAAYALTDLIAEKFRALLQQVTRNRYRRQDVYDIAYLATRFPPDADDRASILMAILDKCGARGIAPTIESISDPEVIKRARSEWDTLQQEIGDLPDFEECFAKAEALYRLLPWN